MTYPEETQGVRKGGQRRLRKVRGEIFRKKSQLGVLGGETCCKLREKIGSGGVGVNWERKA